MTIVDMIRRAQREGWALGQFNMSNLETLQAIILAANQAKSPVMVGVSMGTLRHVGLAYLAGLLKGAHAEAQTPIYFHLDHGADFATVRACVEIGFDSVMIDASRFPLDENIARVREVVAFGHPRQVGVEAQVGETWDEEEGDKVETRTNPSQIRDYAAATGIDYLAISFGNTPGRVEGQAGIDMELLEACAAVAPIPLVLHGGTSIPESAVRKAISCGAAKINIDTAIRKAVTSTLADVFGRPDWPSDPRKTMQQVREAAKHAVLEKMELFGSVNRVL